MERKKKELELSIGEWKRIGRGSHARRENTSAQEVNKKKKTAQKDRGDNVYIGEAIRGRRGKRLKPRTRLRVMNRGGNEGRNSSRRTTVLGIRKGRKTAESIP